MAKWHLAKGGVQYGPVEESVFRQWVAEGRVRPEDLVWTDGMPAWAPAMTVPGFFAGVAPPLAVPPVYDPTLKSKIAAGLLGILLGSFGVHNFYLGYTGKGTAQLLITILTCGLGAAISHIWGLVEGIMILTGEIKVDGHGRPLRE